MSTTATLAAAFAADPGFIWVLPEEARRVDRLRQIFIGAERHCARVGGVARVDGGAGVGLWSTRDTMEIGFVDAARSRMLLMPFRIGFEAMRRLTRAEAEGDGLVRDSIDGPFAYLMALAVDPAHHGAGLGRRTVEEVERQARTAGHHTLALRTENPRNVSLYEHLGFSVAGRVTAPSSGLEVTAMAKSL